MLLLNLWVVNNTPSVTVTSLVSTASVTNETTRWGNTDIRNDITVSIELVSSIARVTSVKSQKHW